MDEKAWAIIKAIIAKGNDAVIRKKGDGLSISFMAFERVC